MADTENDTIAKSIEDGTYYAAARSWYSEIFHTPIAQCSYYAILLVLTVLNLYFSFFALTGIFPLNKPIPFTIYSNSVLDDVTRIRRLAESNKEDRNVALMKYLLTSYVINRESYSLDKYELRYRNIWSNSTAQVFDNYKQAVSVTNTQSPYRQYTNLARRLITVDSITYETGPLTSHATVIFSSSVVSIVTNKEIRHTKWKTDITYKYTNFAISQKLASKSSVAEFFGLTESAVKGSGEKQEITPMSFIVSDYQLKELLE